MSRRLGADHKKALLAVRGGADVYSKPLAALLREIAAQHPELLVIGEPQVPVDGYDQRPILGAWLTPAGEARIGTTQEIAQ